MKKTFRKAAPWMAVLSMTGLFVTGCGTAIHHTDGASGRQGNGTGTSQTGNTGSGSSQSNSTGVGSTAGAKNSSGTNNSSGGTANASGTNGSNGSGTSGQSGNGSASSSGQGTTGTTNVYAGWPKPGSWIPIHVKSLSPLPQGILGNALAMSPSGTPISVGGYTGRVSITNVYQLLPTVATVANLPMRTHDAAVGFVGNVLYVFGGGQATSYNSVVAIQNGGAKNVATLSQPLSDATSVPITVGGQNGLALVGGYNGSVFRPDVAFMTVASSSGDASSGHRVWKRLFNLSVPVRYGAVASTGGTLYVAGGLGEHGLSNHVYEWSASTQKLTTLATLPSGIQKAALFQAGPYLILIGGETAAGHPQSNILEIDTRTGKLAAVGKFPTAIADMGYTQSNNAGYIAGGITTSSDLSATRSVYEITWQK